MWQIQPPTASRKERGAVRRYLPGTAILETAFDTASDRIVVTDWMSWNAPDPCLVRSVRGEHGTVDIDLGVRFDYGGALPWCRRLGRRWRMMTGGDAMWRDTDVRLDVQSDRLVGTQRIAAGAGDTTIAQCRPAHHPLRLALVLASTFDIDTQLTVSLTRASDSDAKASWPSASPMVNHEPASRRLPGSSPRAVRVPSTPRASALPLLRDPLRPSAVRGIFNRLSFRPRRCRVKRTGCRTGGARNAAWSAFRRGTAHAARDDEARRFRVSTTVLA